MTESTQTKTNTKQLLTKEEHNGQRIDNFLIRYFDNLPKSRIYQMIRKGEVRVNKGRIKQTYRLKTGDQIRIPPVYRTDKKKVKPSKKTQEEILKSIIYQDKDIIIINKPANISVHGGTGQDYGLIEAIRSASPEYQQLELAHRLDKQTSGCLILARSIPVVRAINEQLKRGAVKKLYTALLSGCLKKQNMNIEKKLNKSRNRGSENKVEINSKGKNAFTKIDRIESFDSSTLVDVELLTGRTHQIRVHTASIGHPVVGDQKYGAPNVNKQFREKGLKRLFLHARSLDFLSPTSGKKIYVEAPLSHDLLNVLDKIRD